MALMNGDVKSNVATSSNTVVGGPARVKTVYYNATAGAGSIILKDGGSSGTVMMTIATPANGYGNVYIPGDGIRFETDVYIALTNITSATVFYG